MIQQENQLDTARSSVTVPIKELEKVIKISNPYMK
jgi:hypothetical protein